MWTGPDVPWAIRQTTRDCPYVTIADEHMAQVHGIDFEAWKADRAWSTSMYVRAVAASIPKDICGSALWWQETGLTVVCTMDPPEDEHRHGWEHVARRLPEEAPAHAYR